MVLVFLEIILFPDRGLRLLVLMGEIRLEAGAEVDVPTPESAQERLRGLVVMRAELAVFAGVVGHRDRVSVRESKIRKVCGNIHREYAILPFAVHTCYVDSLSKKVVPVFCGKQGVRYTGKLRHSPGSGKC